MFSIHCIECIQWVNVNAAHKISFITIYSGIGNCPNRFLMWIKLQKIKNKNVKKSVLLDRAWETHMGKWTKRMFRNADCVSFFFFSKFCRIFFLLPIHSMPLCSRTLCGHANLYVCHAITAATNAVLFFQLHFISMVKRIKMFQNVNLSEIVPLCDWNICFHEIGAHSKNRCQIADDAKSRSEWQRQISRVSSE